MSLEDYRDDVVTCFGASCGFCERKCPVYQIIKKKTFTSRGRNRAILGIIEGKVKPSKELAEAYSAKVETKAHNALYERPATLSLLPPVKGKRVLDAGCGPGVTAQWLVDRGAEVVGFDADHFAHQLIPPAVAWRPALASSSLAEASARLSARMIWNSSHIVVSVLMTLKPARLISFTRPHLSMSL